LFDGFSVACKFMGKSCKRANAEQRPRPLEVPTHTENIEITLDHRRLDGLRRASHLEDFFESYPLHRNRMLRWLGSTSAFSAKLQFSAAQHSAPNTVNGVTVARLLRKRRHECEIPTAASLIRRLDQVHFFVFFPSRGVRSLIRSSFSSQSSLVWFGRT